MLDDIGEVRRAMLRNLPEQANRQHRSDDADQEDDQQQHVEGNPQASAAAQRLLDGRDRRFAGHEPIHGPISAGLGTRSVGCAR